MKRRLLYILFILLSGISPAFAPGKKSKQDRALAGVEFVMEQEEEEEGNRYE